MSWTDFGLTDLPSELEPEAGETLAEWNARIVAYNTAHPGVLLFMNAANWELALKHAYDKAMTDSGSALTSGLSGKANTSHTHTVSSLGSGTPASGKYLDGGGTWTTLPSAQSGGGFTVLVYSGSAYPARPATDTCPAGEARYVGPSQPTDWLAGDEWIDNT